MIQGKINIFVFISATNASFPESKGNINLLFQEVLGKYRLQKSHSPFLLMKNVRNMHKISMLLASQLNLSKGL